MEAQSTAVITDGDRQVLGHEPLATYRKRFDDIDNSRLVLTNCDLLSLKALGNCQALGLRPHCTGAADLVEPIRFTISFCLNGRGPVLGYVDADCRLGEL